MATQTIERSVERPAAALDAAFPGRYLSVTSFKRDGTGVATPVWFVSDGRRLFALTDLHSAKVRRMRRIPRVLVASCRADGRLRSKPVPARVEVLTAAPDLERVRRLLLQRYKLSYRLVMLIYRLGRRVRGQSRLADGAALAITVDQRVTDPWAIGALHAYRGDGRTRRRTVTAKDEFNRQVRLTALLTVGLLAALIFGIIVLAGGDWIPGTLIVAASAIGLAHQIPVIDKLCRQAPPSRPHGKPTG
jgi:PPOX class probable F420-dependent enzyme